MGIWAWLIPLAFSAAFATAVQYLVFHTTHPRPDEFDWVFLAGGALIGGFTAHVWYPGIGPVVDGLHLLPAPPSPAPSCSARWRSWSTAPSSGRARRPSASPDKRGALNEARGMGNRSGNRAFRWARPLGG